MRYAILAALLLLSACASVGPVTDCAWMEQILISKDDSLTEGTASQILAHNETGAVLGCW